MPSALPPLHPLEPCLHPASGNHQLSFQFLCLDTTYFKVPLLKRNVSHCGGILSDFFPGVIDLERWTLQNCSRPLSESPAINMFSQSLYNTESETQGHFPSLLMPPNPPTSMATIEAWAPFNQPGQCPGTPRYKNTLKRMCSPGKPHQDNTAFCQGLQGLPQTKTCLICFLPGLNLPCHFVSCPVPFQNNQL